MKSREDATIILDKFRSDKSIVTACIYDAKGCVFASYLSKTKTHINYILLSEYKKHLFYDNYIQSYFPIMDNGVLIGAACIEVDLNRINCLAKQNIIRLIMTLVLSLLLAILVAFRLQIIISKPIVELTKKAMRISLSSDYSLRMPTTEFTETQILSNALNDMLTTIQKTIRDTHDNLDNL